MGRDARSDMYVYMCVYVYIDRLISERGLKNTMKSYNMIKKEEEEEG